MILDNAVSYIIEKCKSRHAQYYLFANGLLDAFFPWFPPIEFLLTPICTAQPSSWVRMASWGLGGTILGATLVYVISVFFTSHISELLSSIPSLGYNEEHVKAQFNKYGFLSVFILSLLPLPVLFTAFVAGSQEVNYAVFSIAVLIARGSRFYFFGFIISRHNEKIDYYLRKHTMSILLILVGAFVVLLLGVQIYNKYS